jgi:hypothetical protein
MKSIIAFFKSDTLWKQIIGTTVATGIIWIITIVIGVLKGLDYYSSIQLTLNILNSKISLAWLFLVFVAFLILIRRNNARTLKEIKNWTLSKSEINKRLEQKTDIYRFERFEEVYDYRRLKNHPWHEQYINDEVKSFINMISEGVYKTDTYKMENGICGLVIELKERGWMLSSEKNEVIKLLNSCFQNEYNHNKNELEQIIKEIKII